MQKKNWIWVFISILALVTFSSVYSLINPEIYILDSGILSVKSHFLDLINIGVIIPLGIIVTILVFKNNHRAKLTTIGITVYSLYMFGFNALSLRFNELFLVYIIIFGLSIFYSVSVYYGVIQDTEDKEYSFRSKLTSIYLILFAIIPAMAWLSEITISIINQVQPIHNIEQDVTANVVHIFDLAFILPLIIISAISLIRGKKTGLISAFISVVFVMLVCLSILSMEVGLVRSGLNYDAPQLYSMMLLIPLGIISMIILKKELKDE